jgi:hypothetical protein
MFVTCGYITGQSLLMYNALHLMIVNLTDYRAGGLK